jgi:glutathione peroxidase
MSGVYDFQVRNIQGEWVSLQAWRGQVLLIVNTASRCGFTPQYAGLEALQQRYAEQGFSVLAFPCNQFGAQEPGDAADIQDFCRSQFALSLPLFAKVEVNGAQAAPLFSYLRQEAPGVLGSSAIKWNFTKFLIRRDGTVARRYGSMTPPSALTADIEQLLLR